MEIISLLPVSKWDGFSYNTSLGNVNKGIATKGIVELLSRGQYPTFGGILQFAFILVKEEHPGSDRIKIPFP
ncbi:hypothetical protein STEG23_000029, partial [Scotinomys teguina]